MRPGHPRSKGALRGKVTAPQDALQRLAAAPIPWVRLCKVATAAMATHPLTVTTSSSEGAPKVNPCGQHPQDVECGCPAPLHLPRLQLRLHPLRGHPSQGPAPLVDQTRQRCSESLRMGTEVMEWQYCDCLRLGGTSCSSWSSSKPTYS